MNHFNILQLLNLMPLHVYWKDINSVYLGCNLAQARFFGLQSPDDVIGKTDRQLTNNLKLAETWVKNDQEVMRHNKTLVIEETSFINNHRIVGLSCKIPFKNEHGEVAGLMGITIDITAQKDIETKLTEEKNNAQIALDNVIARLPGHVYWMDKENRYLGCNNLHAESAGLKNRNEIIGKTNSQMPWAHQAKVLDAINNIVINSGKERIEEESGELADGTKKTFLSIKAPLLNNEQTIVGLVGVALDITDRKHMEQELIQTKNSAEAANRAKTKFLANMSHDVKTPLTGIVGMADILAHDASARESDRQRAEAIYDCGMKVVSFFDSCLEFSKLEMEEWLSKEEAFSVEKLLEEIYALFAPLAETKSLTLTIAHDENLPATLHGHRASIYRVMLNLVGNALKFTRQGDVSLYAFLANQNENNIQLGIEVKDTGIGIPEDKQDVIFEKLCRLTPAYEDNIEGSGIGLYIVDQYIKRMKGSIKVNSALGKGSIFTVLLPVTIAPEAAAKNQSILKKSDTQKSLTSSLPQIPISAPKEISAESEKHRPYILLVEDNLIVQKVTQSLLSEEGFKVDIASTGSEAVRKFSPGKYDLIYMDIGLPDIDGYVVTQKMREKERTEGARKTTTPIIALTGHGAVDVQTFCGQAGMQGILSKPVTREQLSDVWRRFGQNEAVTITGFTFLEEINP